MELTYEKTGELHLYVLSYKYFMCKGSLLLTHHDPTQERNSRKKTHMYILSCRQDRAVPDTEVNKEAYLGQG